MARKTSAAKKAKKTKKKAAKKMGRPPKPIDWNQVDKLCALQCTEEEIAHVFNVHIDTLNDRCKKRNGETFAEYSEAKRASGKMSLRRAQWKKAVDDNNTIMQIWLGKQYLEQAEQVHHVGIKKLYDLNNDPELLEAEEAV